MKNRKSISKRLALITSLSVACSTPTVFAATTTTPSALGHSVTTIQQTLNKLGFSVGSVDGQYGPHTIAAVEAFQKAHHVPVTGTVDGATWTLLSRLGQTVTTPSTPTIRDFRVTQIYLEKKLISTPHAFTAGGTTYMPIWYLMQMLKTLNVQSSWDGKELALTTPSSMAVNLDNVSLASGKQTISINGTIVARISGIPYLDPSTNNLTQYMPIWYLQQVLKRLAIQSTWDGKQWALTQPVTVTYTDYSATGQSLGTYSSLDAAKQALANVPGGTVKDSQGNLVYTQPVPVTYTALTATGTTLGTFTNLADAEAALANYPGGTVVDSNKNVVYTQPQAVTYTAYLAGGASIGTFPILDDAKAALMNNPGAVVKDSNGKLVYTQPVPYAVLSSTGNVLGLFNQLADAQALLKDNPGSCLRDSSGNALYSQPSTTTYTAYTVSGTVINTSGSLSDAISALLNQVGGYVRDNQGNLVYTQSANQIYTCYDPNGVALSGGTFTALTDAKTFLATIPGGYTKDSAGDILFIQPIQQPYVAFASSGAVVGIFQTITDAEVALAIFPGGTVKNPSGTVLYTQPGGSGGSVSPNGFQTVDLRYSAPSNLTASAIDQYLTAHGSFMAGLGQVFLYAQNTYGVDANYLVSHAIQETGWTASPIALGKDNLYGYGAYDSNPGTDAGRFPSYEYDIRFQAWEVRQNYLSSSSSLYVTPTLQGMNVHYATDQRWAAGIAALMGQLAGSVGDSVNSYKQYTPANQPAAPVSSSEPVFRLNGATAVISSVPNYSGLPYYPDWPTGNSLMFVRNLQAPMTGSDVSTLQRALNSKIGAGLTVDGQFGPMTSNAVKRYQQIQGLSQTGVCNFQLWNMLVSSSPNVIPANTKVTVDEMMQGLSAGLVVEWYHVPNYGWVNSQYVQFTNTYRLTVSNPTAPSAGSLPIYSTGSHSTVITTMHAGDWVVSTNPSPVSGFITIQFVNQQTGQFLQGAIDASKVTLTAIQ